jgi:Tol biopolymer transport system component/DNA-binding winged helix-turn-helix (wHTH) protein
MSKPNQPFYEFGEFQLDPTERILLQHGTHVHLQPKTFETLLALVEHSGHVVRKEELLERVWPDTFVEEINLTKNISTLRKTLRNGNGAGEFIETIPTVGYRFIVKVRQVENGDYMNGRNGDAARKAEGVAISVEERHSASPSPQPRASIFRRRQWLWYGLALLLIVGVSVAWFQRLPPLSAIDAFAPVRLTNHVARDLYPAYAPDGKKIAFNSNRNGLPAIYVMNADGSDVRKISGEALNCGRPKWSADGKKIFFSAQVEADGPSATYAVSAEGGHLAKFSNLRGEHSPDDKKMALVRSLVADSKASAEIFVANADGSGEVRLTKNNRLDADPAWSPDGRHLTFTCFPDGFVEGEPSNAEICVMNADGGNTIRLTHNPTLDNMPVWSPDGTRIAFYSARDCKSGQAIYVMNADGSNQMHLTECQNFEGEGVWSPDSKKFVYASYRNGNPELYAINADPSQQTNLTRHPAEDSEPTWSPDGKQIAFISNRDGKASLFVMDADGANPRRLTDDALARLSWSPDGRWIVFATTRAGNADLCVINADGSQLTQLTHNPENEGFPVWSPDGKKILYNNDRDGVAQLYAMNTNGSGVTRISHSAEHEWQQDWSPDGQQIVFTRSRHRGVQRDIWLMNADGSNPRLLASAPGNDELLFPCFSPDGQRIAFHRRVASPLQTDVWMMNADGSRQTRLTYLGGGVPAWSPDGKKLAFQSQKRTGNNEIYAMQVK